MEAIKNWVNCILIVVVIIGIIEVIVPEGETKKFVFLITQITVSIVIAVPVLKFFKSDFAFEDVFNINYIEENSFYLDTLRSTVDRQTNMLESVYSENIVKEFNLKYPDMKLATCRISFIRDLDGKIMDINLIEVSSKNKIDDVNLLKSRVSTMCEVDKSKVRVG